MRVGVVRARVLLLVFFVALPFATPAAASAVFALFFAMRPLRMKVRPPRWNDGQNVWKRRIEQA
jgi:hypothetical protein